MINLLGKEKKFNFYWWDWFFIVGEVRFIDSLESYIVVGYDFFIYVYDGIILVGLKILIVIVIGMFMKDFMD